MKHPRLTSQAELIICFDVRSIGCCSASPFTRLSQSTEELSTSVAADPLPACATQATGEQLQLLPAHLVNKILDSLPPDSLLNASQVCTSWQQLIQQDQYKQKRVAWHHKSFLQPGHVASFKAKKRLLSYATQHRLTGLTTRVGKTLLLQFS